MKSKILTMFLTTAVVLGLLLVPAMSVPAVAQGPLDVGIEMHPSKALVGWNEAFTADIYINNSANHVINAWGCNFTFTQSLINVTGITLNASVFNNVMPVDWSNTTGWAAMGALRTTTVSTNLSWIHVATIDLKSKYSTGIAYLNFILGGVTNIADYPSALNCLNDTLVVNATVKVGSPTLVVAVSDGSTMNVSFNSTYVDRYQTVVNLTATTATALVQFCPFAVRDAFTIPVKLMYAYQTVDINTMETLQQVAYMLADLNVTGNYTLGEPVTRTYVYDAGHGNYSAVGNNWSYNVTLVAPDVPINQTFPGWAKVMSQNDPVNVSSCGVPLGAVPCFHIAHTNCPPAVATYTPAPGGNVTSEDWIANPYIPGPLSGAGLVQMKDHWTFTDPSGTHITETSVLAGVHPIAVANASRVDITGIGQVAPSYPNITHWNWSDWVELTATSQVPGWYFSHWTGDLWCSNDTIKMDTDVKTVFPNYCEAPPALSYDPSSFTGVDKFECNEGSNPVSDTLEIWNSGGYQLDWGVGVDAVWLNATPISGNSTGEHDSVTVSVDTNATGTWMTKGTYWGNVTITTLYGPTKVLVELLINPATTVPSCRAIMLTSDSLLPGETNETYAGETFKVYVNFTAPAINDFNAIGLTDVAPDGWTVQVDKNWCDPVAYTCIATGNKAEILWQSIPNSYAVSARYNVTVPTTADPGLNSWGNCSKSWLEYYFGMAGPHTACILCNDTVVVTVPGDIVGETFDVNHNPLPDTDVRLWLNNTSPKLRNDISTPLYVNTAYITGTYFLVGNKTRYFELNTNGTDPIHLDEVFIGLTNQTLLSAGYTFNFSGMYGLVPRACDMKYALKSVNLWVMHASYPPEVGLDEIWKPNQVINSWQFPS